MTKITDGPKLPYQEIDNRFHLSIYHDESHSKRGVAFVLEAGISREEWEEQVKQAADAIAYELMRFYDERVF